MFRTTCWICVASLVIVAAGPATPARGQPTKTYRVGEQTYRLTVDPDRILVQLPRDFGFFEGPEQVEELARSITRLQADLADLPERPPAIELGTPISIPGVGPALITRRLRELDAGRLAALDELLAGTVRVVYSAIDKHERRSWVVPVETITLKFARPDRSTPNVLEDIRERFGLELLKQNGTVEGMYTLRLTAPPGDRESDVFYVQSRIQDNYADSLDWVEPDFAFQVRMSGNLPNDEHFVPDDCYFREQWGIGEDPPGLGIVRAWAEAGGRGSSEIRVAVIDNGFDLGHEDFNAMRIHRPFNAADGDREDVRGQDFEAHGTHTAGIISAVAGNGRGIAGIAPGCTLIPIRAFTGENGGTSAQAMEAALEHAIQEGAHIINISAEFPDISHRRISTNLDDIEDQILVVAAAGNGTDTGSYDVVFPARHPACIAVGALDPEDRRWVYSNYTQGQTFVSLMAPSGGPSVLGSIYTLDPSGSMGANRGGEHAHLEDPELTRGDLQGNYYFRFNGTSAAAPLVSGTAALVWSAAPNLSAKQVRQILESTATPIIDGGIGNNQSVPNEEYGYGKVNPVAAIRAAKAK